MINAPECEGTQAEIQKHEDREHKHTPETEQTKKKSSGLNTQEANQGQVKLITTIIKEGKRVYWQEAMQHDT